VELFLTSKEGNFLMHYCYKMNNVPFLEAFIALIVLPNFYAIQRMIVKIFLALLRIKLKCHNK
jgi:hypothetical protein